MKVSEQWLRSWINPAISRTALSTQLNMAGIEVSAVLPVANSFNKIVAGKIISIDVHPKSENLKVCQVSIGQNKLLTIVCGAMNARVDTIVPVALDGAKLPHEKSINNTTIQGIVSEGMLCSQAELGLSESSEGLWELPTDTPLGVELWTYLELDDYIFDIELTPNRGDCLSVNGLAREIGVLNRSKILNPNNSQSVSSQINEMFSVNLLSPKDCPNYVGRIIRQINNHAKTPLWMQERLRRSGIRTISLIVDVMNYVMLEIGQPLHAFDLASLSKSIQVRRARANEQLQLLDGQNVTLNEDILVIADEQECHALAGVMGGLRSAVTENTTDIFIESAYFNPVVIAGRARQLGLNTDAAYRFERGVDPTIQKLAIERATELIVTLGHGIVGPITEATAQDYLPKLPEIILRKSRLNQILGFQIPDNEVTEILRYLGMQVNERDGDWQVIPPSYRFDILREVDLVEEVVRIYGYQHIPQRKPNLPVTFIAQSELKLSSHRLRNLLIDRGYQEVITYSFISQQLQELFDPLHQPLALVNPLSPELAVMRTSLWPSLVNVLIYNLNRQMSRLRLFETGLRFIQNENELKQESVIAGLIAGNVFPEQWGIASRSVDFYDIKNDVFSLLNLTGKTEAYSFVAQTHPALHPGQSCAIYLNDKHFVGFFGALHPAIKKMLGITEPVFLFECFLNTITDVELPQFKAVSRFPNIRRDIAFIVDQEIQTQQLQNAIISSAGELLVSLQLFDVYQGKGIATGKKSVALGLIFQCADRTLKESEINELVERIITTLKKQFNVSLRD